MPIRMIALIMVVHNCPLGRLLGKGGWGLGRSSVVGMGSGRQSTRQNSKEPGELV